LLYHEKVQSLKYGFTPFILGLWCLLAVRGRRFLTELPDDFYF